MQSDFGKFSSDLHDSHDFSCKLVCVFFLLGGLRVGTRNLEGNRTITIMKSTAFFPSWRCSRNFLGKISLEHYYFRLLKFHAKKKVQF